jgi:hypothetical protein
MSSTPPVSVRRVSVSPRLPVSLSARPRVSLSPCPPVSRLEAMKGVEPLSFGLQDRRSVIQLSYIAGENVLCASYFLLGTLTFVLCSRLVSVDFLSVRTRQEVIKHKVQSTKHKVRSTRL